MPKNRTPKGTDPEDRMGVYKRLADVPDRYRLRNYADAYEDRDVWAEFVAYERETHGYDSDRYREIADRCGRRWKAHMADRGRHHALATPEDLETFMHALWAPDGEYDLSLRTVYETYWTRLEAFYDWLQRHTEHPHRYHPVLMAANEGEYAHWVWNEKLDKNDKR